MRCGGTDVFSVTLSSPGRMRQDYRNVLPMEKSCVRVLFAGGREVQIFVGEPGARSGLPGCRGAGEGGEKPSAPPGQALAYGLLMNLLTRRKGCLGLLLVSGGWWDTHRPAAPF